MAWKALERFNFLNHTFTLTVPKEAYISQFVMEGQHQFWDYSDTWAKTIGDRLPYNTNYELNWSGGSLRQGPNYLTEYRLYDAADNLKGYVSNNWSDSNWLTVLINEETQQGYITATHERNGYGTTTWGYRIYYGDLKDVYNILIGGIPVEYNLHSIKQTNGVDATLHFTQLYDDDLNNGDYVTLQDQSALKDRDNRSILVSLFAGGEHDLITTFREGDNWMGLKARSTRSGLNTTCYLVVEYHVDDTQISYPIEIYTGADLGKYLGMLEDAERHTAAPTIIDLNVPGGGMTCNTAVTASTLGGYIGPYLYAVIHGQKAYDPDDPYSNLPTSDDPEGGNGDHNYISDDNPNTDVPPNMAVNLGFITMFAATSSKLRQLAGYLWSSNLIDAFKKLYANPMECLLGLAVYPFHVNTGADTEVAIGNVGTGIEIPICNSEYQDIDLKTIHIDAQLNSFLDYAPHTKLEVYLPFCGTYSLNSDKYVGKDVNVKYRVNLLTGGCTATLTDVTNGKANILSQFTGNIGYQIPMTATNYGQMISAAIGMISGVAEMGVGAALGNGHLLGRGLGSAISAASTLKGPSIEKAGALGSNTGATACLRPYFIETCPRLVNPRGKNEIIGTPSGITSELSDVSGFTQISHIHISSASATRSELMEIEDMLEKGVIL